MSKSANKYRHFQEYWSEEFFVKKICDDLENEVGAQCIIPGCEKILKLKKCNISAHFEKFHKNSYGAIKDDDRKALVEKLCGIPTAVVEPSCDKVKKRKIASFQIAMEVAKSEKSFKHGEFIKRVAAIITDTLGFAGASKEISLIPSSERTIGRRVEILDDYVKTRIKNLCKSAEFIAVGLDESTDNGGLSQLIVFARIVQRDFKINEEMLCLTEMETTTKGIDFWQKFDEITMEFDIQV